MSDGQRAAFVERSLEAYGCDPTAADSIPAPANRDASPDVKVEGLLDLVVGGITSPDVDNIDRLLSSLSCNLGTRSDVRLSVLLLENGLGDASSRSELREVVVRASCQGLAVDLKTLEQQKADVDAGVFKVGNQSLSKRKSIALSRTML